MQTGLWQTLTSRIPLENGRDAAARIAVRFVFCTFPYFTLATFMHALGDDRMLRGWIPWWILLIPILGGIVDAIRLRKRSRHDSASQATPHDAGAVRQ